jgi:uncharacterized protein YpbB
MSGGWPAAVGRQLRLLQVKRAETLHQRLKSRARVFSTEESIAEILWMEIVGGESLVIVSLNLTVKFVDGALHKVSMVLTSIALGGNELTVMITKSRTLVPQTRFQRHFVNFWLPSDSL